MEDITLRVHILHILYLFPVLCGRLACVLLERERKIIRIPVSDHQGDLPYFQAGRIKQGLGFFNPFPHDILITAFFGHTLKKP